MGLLDTIVSKATLVIKADTSQAKAAIKDLSGEEKKAAAARLEQLERENLRLEGSTKSWLKFAAGVGATVGAFHLMSKAAGAAIADAERSGTAGEGAAKAWTDATKKWNSAVDDLMVAFGKLVIELAPAVDVLADLVKQVSAALELLNAPGDFGRGFVGAGQAFGSIAGQLTSGQRSHSRNWLDFASKANGWVLGSDFSVKDRDLGGLNELFDAGINKVSNAWGALGKKLQPRSGKRGTARDPGMGADDLEDILGIGRAFGNAAGDVGGAFSSTYTNARKGVTLGTEDTAGLERLRATLEQAKRDYAEWQGEIAAMAQARQMSMLETIFGTPAEFSNYQTMLEQLGGAFNVFASAAGSAMDAWITGSKSIGTAFKEAIADGLRSLAVQATVESLKHGAFALGSLAFGNFPAAAAHGLAAAEFAGVAVAAGIGARAMGQHTGQWSGGGGGGAGGGGHGGGFHTGGGGGSTPSEGGGQIVVMLGSDFGMLTSLEQKQLLSSAIRLGQSRARGTKRIRRGS